MKKAEVKCHKLKNQSEIFECDLNFENLLSSENFMSSEQRVIVGKVIL